MKSTALECIPMSRNSPYTREQVLEAATYWVVSGNANYVERVLGVPDSTIGNWRKQEWWERLIEAIRAEKAEELDGALTGVIHKAVKEVADRLENGEVRKGEKGDLIRVPVSARDAMTIGAIAWDKRQIGRNLPTSITENTSDRLKALQAQLAAASGRTIEGEVVRADD